MKKLLSIILILAMAVLAIPAFAHDAYNETNVLQIRTNEQGASLRSSPEVPQNSNANKIASVHQYEYLDVIGVKNGWFYVYYNGMYGYISSNAKWVTITKYKSDSGSTSQSGSGSQSSVTRPSASQPRSAGSNLDPYDMGVPSIGSQVYRLNQQNMVVLWVQTQLKATGIWYQGEMWDVTGNLGDHTMSEIAAFMRSRGYSGHQGNVDQRVIDELAAFLGSQIEPVYVGGFYEYMNSLMSGGSEGSFYTIVSNLRDMIPHVTTGARWIQVILSSLGYYDSTIDGMYGEGTENAVKRFQRNSGFEERDYVSLGVARAMLEQYYYRGYSVYHLP